MIHTFPILLTTADVARLVGWTSARTAERYARTGQITSFQIGGAYKFRLSDVERFVESRRFSPITQIKSHRKQIRGRHLEIFQAAVASVSK